MSRNKGKSQRRVKDWMQRVDSAGELEDQAARSQCIGAKGVKLPPSRQAQHDNLEDLPRTTAMVVGIFPGGVIVEAQSGPLLCGIAGTFRAPEGSTALAVGDDVTIALTLHADTAGAADKDRADGMILQRQPRRTALARPQPRSSKRSDRYSTEVFEKVIAANMDVLLMVAASRQPPLRHGLIDRFMIIAERGGLEPVLVINKIDLGRPEEGILSEFEEMGLRMLQVSAVSGEGLVELAGLLNGRRTVLAGASGVGKSTLINALIPGAKAVTREIRQRDQRGRHTTTSSDVYDMPGGGVIVDTPGIRELGIHLDLQELPWYFPEFAPLSSQCRFNDCTHTHEPDCAVRDAAVNGQILPRRYESYLRIRETVRE